MAVKIRLARMGKKNKPFYRIVAIDESAKRNGKVVENLGYYNPEKNSPKIKVNEKSLKLWLSLGAQPTTPVRKLLNL